MTDNPLLGRVPVRETWDLDAYCHRLNATSFANGSGRPYFISERTNADGSTTRYLNRQA